MKTGISADEARRIALAAQGFASPRTSARPDRRHLRRVIAQIGLLQIDSVNVLVRSHYMPLFSRLGSYAPEMLDSSWLGAPADRELFEYWGRMASLMPFELHPLLRWRMAEAAENHKDSDTRVATLERRRPGFMRAALDEIAERGPLSAREISGAGASKGGWWGWSDGKRALEALFAAGQVAAAGRRGFERLYDLPDRVIPARVLAMPTPAIEDAQRALLRIAARALGVGTEKDLCDYFRIRIGAGRHRIRELVETGELMPVSVEGWPAPAYLERDAKSPRKLDAHALLSPFDSLVWERARTERIFGFRYRIEIYTPSAKRKYGYYVLPFLLGDRLVARVDLKSDRATRTLLVQGAHCEPGVRPSAVVEPLMRELVTMAPWLGLERIKVTRRGDLAKKLCSTRT
ncbi:MAG TPA: winged helix-turn-helix domain-containing protein [Candidatus Binatus sp.]|uniref:winged helix-turn-helix domain-containing protein n=1 Tax=Candidatus Binatus sp. TaxID=2811406 RepID=UPI002B487337|nr:winged helix-turn-helix domain-containing protein [Candidatus Binatus sp.]HKN13848.1 winged helix-turn-helix domain-containing protein [Candidatus Binatus sp.]